MYYTKCEIHGKHRTVLRGGKVQLYFDKLFGNEKYSDKSSFYFNHKKVKLIQQIIQIWIGVPV